MQELTRVSQRPSSHAQSGIRSSNGARHLCCPLASQEGEPSRARVQSLERRDRLQHMHPALPHHHALVSSSRRPVRRRRQLLVCHVRSGRSRNVSILFPFRQPVLMKLQHSHLRCILLPLGNSSPTVEELFPATGVRQSRRRCSDSTAQEGP
jgi:hypothetical protein